MRADARYRPCCQMLPWTAFRISSSVSSQAEPMRTISRDPSREGAGSVLPSLPKGSLQCEHTGTRALSARRALPSDGRQHFDLNVVVVDIPRPAPRRRLQHPYRGDTSPPFRADLGAQLRRPRAGSPLVSDLRNRSRPNRGPSQVRQRRSSATPVPCQRYRCARRRTLP